MSSLPKLDMKAGDLIELLDNNDSTNSSDVTPTSSSRAESRDLELLYGRNEKSGKKGTFAASCVYVLPTVEKPTHDFVVSSLWPTQ